MIQKSLFQVPYLRTSRNFPNNLDSLSIELNKSYIDTALCVNLRTIGIFPTKYASITGESWHLNISENQNGARKQQGLRQVFHFTSFAPIDHYLNLDDIERFTRCYGEYTDETNWYGLISGTSVLIPGQVVFYITPTQIVFVVDGSEPAILNGDGVVVLEWLSNV